MDKNKIIYSHHPSKKKLTSLKKNCCQGSREKGTLVHCWWECRLVQPLWKIVWRFLKKLKMKLLYDSAITQGMYSKKLETLILKEHMHPYVHCSIIYNSQDMEATQVPINR